VLAAADGVVERVAYDLRKLDHRDARTGRRAQGWGWYVVLRHWNGSSTLYAHLSKASISHLRLGKLLRRGETVGRAGDSGAVTGPHLHFEFSPSGAIFESDTKVDAHLCVETQI
jgi:murein DD-endopeptidase MepM/ murein hydrolase activator NlpD